MNSSTTSQPVWSLETPKGLKHLGDTSPAQDDKGVYFNDTGFYYFCGILAPGGLKHDLTRGPFATAADLKADHAADNVKGALEFLGLDPETPYTGVHGTDKIRDFVKSLESPLGGLSGGPLGALLMAAMTGGKPPLRRRAGFSESFEAAYGQQKMEYVKKETVHETVRSVHGKGLAGLLFGSRHEALMPQAFDFEEVEGDNRILVHKADNCGAYWHFDMVPDSGMIVGEFLTLETAQRSADEYTKVYEQFFKPAADQQAPDTPQATNDAPDATVTVDRSALEEVLRSFGSNSYRPARLWKAVQYLERSIGLPDRERSQAVEEAPLSGFIRLHAVFEDAECEMDIELMALDSFRTSGSAGKAVSAISANGQTIFVKETCSDIRRKIREARGLIED